MAEIFLKEKQLGYLGGKLEPWTFSFFPDLFSDFRSTWPWYNNSHWWWRLATRRENKAGVFSKHHSTSVNLWPAIGHKPIFTSCLYLIWLYWCSFFTQEHLSKSWLQTIMGFHGCLRHWITQKRQTMTENLKAKAGGWNSIRAFKISDIFLKIYKSWHMPKAVLMPPGCLHTQGYAFTGRIWGGLKLSPLWSWGLQQVGNEG